MLAQASNHANKVDMLQSHGYISPECNSYHDAETAGNLTDRYRLLPERVYGPYLLAMVIQDEEDLMLDYLSTVLSLVAFLGPESMHVSIVEQSSADKTKWYLDTFVTIFKSLDIQYSVQQDPESAFDETKHFPSYMARLRNHALKPLFGRYRYTRVIWLKGSICRDDVLELLHQSFIQGSTVTCGVDLILAQDRLRFHDTWVARDMDGNAFGWEFDGDAQHVVRDQHSIERLQKGLPFQVMSCAMGTHVINTDNVFYVRTRMKEKVMTWLHEGTWSSPEPMRYRGARNKLLPWIAHGRLSSDSENEEDMKECSDSELSIFCRDLWRAGKGKILVVPKVRNVYDKQTADWVRAQESHGWRQAIDVADLFRSNLWWATSWFGHAPDTAVDSFVKWRHDASTFVECREIKHLGSKSPSDEISQARVVQEKDRSDLRNSHDQYL